MAEAFELSFITRDTFGKVAARRLRAKENQIPGVIYGAHKAPQHIAIAENVINRALENEAFYSHILTLDISGEKQKAVLKKIQRDPGSRKIIHFDFLRVSATEKITMNVPLHFTGEDKAPGVTQEDGVVLHAMNEVEIRCLPGDLPEFIEVDISQLKLNESIHLSQLKLPKNVDILAFTHGDDIEEHDQTVVSIQMPKKELEEPVPEEAAEGEEEAVKGEAAGAEGEQQKAENEGNEAKKGDNR